MGTQHTPEPWQLDSLNGFSILAPFAGNKYTLSVCSLTPCGGGAESRAEARANARRIVVCVNACADKSEADLNGKLFTEGELKTAVALARKDIEQQRNELLPLKELIDLKFSSGNSVPVDRITITRTEYEAIAKARGQV